MVKICVLPEAVREGDCEGEGWEAMFTSQAGGKESGMAAMSADPQKVSSTLCALNAKLSVSLAASSEAKPSHWQNA